MADAKTLEDLASLQGTEAAAAALPARKLDAQGRAYATGKRKNAVARVWIKSGVGKIVVNTKAFDQYFARPVLQMLIRQPLQTFSSMNEVIGSSSTLPRSIISRAATAAAPP